MVNHTNSMVMVTKLSNNQKKNQANYEKLILCLNDINKMLTNKDEIK